MDKRNERELLEEMIVSNLEMANELPLGEERSRLIREAQVLVEKHQDYLKIDNDAADKAERRRIEEKKNDDAAENEKQKLKVNWKDWGGKLALCLIPLAIKIGVRVVEEVLMYDFEVNGRLTSSVGRMFRPMDLNGKD